MTIGRFNGGEPCALHRSRAFAAAFGFFALGMTQVGGQTIPKSHHKGGPDEFIKQRKNNWTVGLVGGAFDGGDLRLADELGKVVDDGDQLRMIPVIVRGAVGNLQDLLYPSLEHFGERHESTGSATGAGSLRVRTFDRGI